MYTMVYSRLQAKPFYFLHSCSLPVFHLYLLSFFLSPISLALPLSHMLSPICSLSLALPLSHMLTLSLYIQGSYGIVHKATTDENNTYVRQM